MSHPSASAILDLPCPACGPDRRSAANRVRRVMRIWSDHTGRQTFNCIRCGTKGVRDIPAALGDSFSRQPADAKRRTETALRLWQRAVAPHRTPAEVYLREARGYRGPLPQTLRYLAANRRHPHALVAAFGQCLESACGELAPPDAPPAIHLTRLAPDGRSRINKIMLGLVAGHPIIVAPMNDGLGLTIAEGIEDALSLHEATGLGAWAAGSAIHMAKLAATIPDYVACITLAQDNDEAGRTATNQLGAALIARGFEVRIMSLAQAR